ncbi:MAG: metal ABC transporter ATP-binding protein [Gemmatimonadota bacterium]|nr:metal ABC transporter ATP-binding protein [Gemmatimonadota bacterium]
MSSTPPRGTEREGRVPLVRFEDVALSYGGAPVLAGLDFTLCRGDFLGLVGPNGAGKSTVIKGLLGLLKPVRGRIVYEAELHEELQLGYVPQRHTLDPLFPFTVEQIVGMARFRSTGLVRWPGSEDRRVVGESLAAVRIEDLAKRRFGELSGGQRQRTLIARALATGANCLILDEPTDGMDLSSQEAILTLVQRLHEEEALTVVLVSHLLNEVANFVDRLAMIEDGEFAYGTLEEILTEERLSALYGMPVDVERIGDAVVVIPEARV